MSRQEFPAVSYFSLRNYLICSSLACHWVYHKHFVQSGCLRLVNDGNSCCCGNLLEPVVALADVQVKTLPLQLTSFQLIQFQPINVYLTIQWIQTAMILLHLIYLWYPLWSFVIVLRSWSTKSFCNHGGNI